jgi:uncharacterized repeat protein (TIGR03803 family)
MTLRIAVFFLAATLPLPAFAGETESVIHTFGMATGDGIAPLSGLIADSAGNLYGTTNAGGTAGKGTVFKIGPDGTETVLYSFKGGLDDGEMPSAALTLDGKGNLYGTTNEGGISPGDGTVFKVQPNGTETVLYKFCSANASCSDGNAPFGPVTIAKDGTIYGTTLSGGVGFDFGGWGVVFRLDPPAAGKTNWRERVIHDFCGQPGCTDGTSPQWPRLLLADDGKTLYGTAYTNFTSGTLYALSTNGQSFKILHTFGQTSLDGTSPYAGVIADRHGVLYGTTGQGGAYGYGTAYSFDPASGTYQTLYSFGAQSTDPKAPRGGLAPLEYKTLIALYGEADGVGIDNAGALYMLTPPANPGDPWTEKTLHPFCSRPKCIDGSGPERATPLIVGKVVYGTTARGGVRDNGVAFRYGP